LILLPVTVTVNGPRTGRLGPDSCAVPVPAAAPASPVGVAPGV
jgi:hypothetical protein